AGTANRFRVPILHALYDLSEDWKADQLCELARYYAKTGDGVFRDHLYTLVKTKPSIHYPSIGEKEILEIDGEHGFLFAAQVRGPAFSTRGVEMEISSLVRLAGGRMGKGPRPELFPTRLGRIHAPFRRMLAGP